MVRGTSHAIVILIGLGSVAATATGQSNEASRLLAPCLSEQTLAVATIDLTSVDVDAVVDWIVETAPSTMDTKEVEEVTGRWRLKGKERLGFFRTAGAERLFVVWDVSDALLVVPITNRVNEEAMKSCLSGAREDLFGGEATCVHKEGLLIAGSSVMMDRWQSAAAQVRPELAQASAKTGGAAVEVWVIPSRDSRRVLDAMLPLMLGYGMEAKGHPITAGLEWAAIRLDLPPGPSLRLHVKSSNAASALVLRGFLAESLTLLGRIETLKAACPSLEGALATLTPDVNGGTLQLALEKRQCDRLGTDFVTPGVFELRASILRKQCDEVLSSLAKGMLLYANDHDDKWPPSLEVLVETQEYPLSYVRCPAMGHRPEYASYVYRGVDTGGVWVEPMIILMHDKAGNHKGGRNVLFVDSHVEWVTEERFAELVARDNELRRGRGFPEKPVQ